MPYSRMQLLLNKFWGLMHEADRPWHRPLLIRLCCQLPVDTRRAYRAIKPSTMQHLIAVRSKVRLVCTCQVSAGDLAHTMIEAGTSRDNPVDWAQNLDSSM